MAVATYDELLPFLVPSLPGCPKALILQEIGRVYRDFCRRTAAWNETLSVDLVAEQDEYTLPSPSYRGIIEAVISIHDDEGRELSTVYDYSVNTPENSIRLFSSPSADKADGISVLVSVIPSSDIDVIISEVWTRYKDALISGVMANLTAMPKKPWSDFNMVAYYRAQYSTEVTACLNSIRRRETLSA